MKDKTLYARRGERQALPLQMTANGELHFTSDELSYFVPVRDAAGRVQRLDYYPDAEGPPRPLYGIDSPSR